MAPERNGTGWRVATILGVLLAAAVAAIVTGATFHYGLVADVGGLDRKVALAGQEDVSMKRSIDEVVERQKATAADVQDVMTAVQYLCVSQTGRPCPKSGG